MKTQAEVFYYRVSKLSNRVLKLWVSQNLVYCLFALLPLTLAVLVEGSTPSPPLPFPLLSKNWWLRYATSGCFFRRENSLPSIPDDITGGVGNLRFMLEKVCQPKECIWKQKRQQAQLRRDFSSSVLDFDIFPLFENPFPRSLTKIPNQIIHVKLTSLFYINSIMLDHFSKSA